jgi:hypothetical protein
MLLNYGRHRLEPPFDISPTCSSVPTARYRFPSSHAYLGFPNSRDLHSTTYTGDATRSTLSTNELPSLATVALASSCFPVSLLRLASSSSNTFDLEGITFPRTTLLSLHFKNGPTATFPLLGYGIDTLYLTHTTNDGRRGMQRIARIMIRRKSSC